ncbi:MAG: PAS domain-containing sensor histidine kinase [Candidatus Kapabacteria bacterium]|nr:PAS domain-containing sensor histidine kinase [Candidatus Kapabacteria bacterium]
MKYDYLSKLLINNSRDAIFLIDNNLNIVSWSNPASEIFLYNEQEILNTSFLNLIQENYKVVFELEFKKLLIGNSEFLDKNLLELFGIRKDNVSFHLEIKLSEVNDNNEKLYLCIGRDVTTRVHYEEELTKSIEELHISKEFIEQNANEFLYYNLKLVESEKRLEEINSNKDRFFSIIAHDLKGPFQSLLGYTELLKDSASDLTTEEITEFSSTLHSSTENLFKLLENLLNWSTLQRGKMEYVPSYNDIKELAISNFELVYPRANMKKVILINKIKEETIAFCDPNMINTVIRNLLSNAIKFTKKDCSITISIEDFDNVFYKVEVKDTGMGMKEDVKNKLFKVGVKVTTLGTENEVGTGLGLILCKEMVELNKGKLWVESEYGLGSSFYFTIPKTEYQ